MVYFIRVSKDFIYAYDPEINDIIKIRIVSKGEGNHLVTYFTIIKNGFRLEKVFMREFVDTNKYKIIK